MTVLAEELMREAVQQEILAAIAEGRVRGDDLTALITAILDGVYSKRSYGHSFNALTGGACIIGAVTGKILDFGILQKFCLVCARFGAEKEHKCSLNWHGASSG